MTRCVETFKRFLLNTSKIFVKICEGFDSLRTEQYHLKSADNLKGDSSVHSHARAWHVLRAAAGSSINAAAAQGEINVKHTAVNDSCHITKRVYRDHHSVTGVTHSKTGSGCIDKLLYPVTRSNLNLSIKAHLTSGSSLHHR